MSVALEGEYAYVIAFPSLLATLDISQPASPVEVSLLELDSDCIHVAVSNGIAYLSDNDGLLMVDVSLPTNPEIIGHTDLPGPATETRIYRDFAIATRHDAGMRIVNIDDPANPFEVGYYPVESYARSAVLDGQFAYLVEDTIFSIYDISAALSADELRNVFPTQFSLHPIYPNPFNNTANITFDLPREVTGRLVAYDVLGRVANTLYDGRLSAGAHSMQFNGTGLSSGTYFVKLETPDFNSVQKAVLLK